MKKFFAIALIILFCFPMAFAVLSSQEAIDFVSTKNNFLLADETAEILPNVKISSQSRPYWVVAVLSGDSLSGFIPIDAEKSEIPSSKILQRDLIKAAYFLRSLDKIKKNAVQQDQWIFSSLNAKRMNDLATQLQSKASLDMTTINSELTDYPDLQATVEKIKAELSILQEKALLLSEDISNASAYENSFYNNPDTSTVETLKGKFDNVFSEIAGLEEKKTQYLLDVDELKQGIAQTTLAIDTKRSLGSLANAPSEIAFVSSLSVSSIGLNEQISNAFDDAIARASTLSDNLDTRIKRSNAYLVLYGTDNEIIDATGEKSLSLLVAMELSNDYAPYWSDQESVALLRDNWQKATAYFENGSFETAVTFAEKAKKNALKAYAAGFEETTPIINTDLLITAVVLIIVLLIIIYILKNRGKFLSLVSSSEEGEKFEFDE